MDKKLRAALGLVGCWAVLSVHATGVNGFVPDNGNVVSPATGLPVASAWKQIGACGASAVQISPSWVVSANHVHCSQGDRFYRQDGSSELIEWEATTQPGQTALSVFDLHLARLARPLPFQGSFVPLVEGVVASGEATAGDPAAPFYRAKVSDACLATDVLLAGNGQAQGFRALRVGWSTFVPGSWVYPDPHREGNTNAGSSDGDSGGGVFLVNAMRPDGMLAGLMHVVGYGLETSHGFPAAARAQIDAVLANPALNPLAEQIQWLDAASAKGALLRAAPVKFDGTGGPMDVHSVGINGMVTTLLANSVRVQLPMPFDCASPGQTLAPADGYRLRLERMDGGSSDRRIADIPGGSFNPYVRDLEPGSTWALQVLARHYDATSQHMNESLAAPRTSFTLAPVLPTIFSHADAVLAARTRVGGWTDGKFHWVAKITVGLPQSGPTPEGAYIFDSSGRWLGKVSFSDLYPNGQDYVVKGLSDVSRTPPYQPGDAVELLVYPYIGASLGKPSYISFTAPASLP